MLEGLALLSWEATDQTSSASGVESLRCSIVCQKLPLILQKKNQGRDISFRQNSRLECRGPAMTHSICAAWSSFRVFLECTLWFNTWMVICFDLVRCEPQALGLIWLLISMTTV